MIVVDVDDHPAVMAVIFMESLAALPHNGMGIGEGVDFPVQQDALLDPYRKMIEFVGPDVIGEKVAQGNFIIVEGKVDVCEKVHRAKILLCRNLQIPNMVSGMHGYICRNLQTI